jgi:morphogenetic protein associated with SpoVID
VKIHVVKRGDTLWNLAEKYGVDFEQLKKINSHLADPDNLMPGMKVKIPTNAVPVKKDTGKKEIPKKDLAKKETPKKESPMKETAKKDSVKNELSTKDLEKKEWPKKEAPKHEIMNKTEKLAEGVMGVSEELKEMLEKVTPQMLSKLLKEVKPGFLEELVAVASAEISLPNKMQMKMPSSSPAKKVPIEEVTPQQQPTPQQPIAQPSQSLAPFSTVPTPPPVPNYQMPAELQTSMPYMPETTPCSPCSPAPANYMPHYSGEYMTAGSPDYFAQQVPSPALHQGMMHQMPMYPGYQMMPYGAPVPYGPGMGIPYGNQMPMPGYGYQPAPSPSITTRGGENSN